MDQDEERVGLLDPDSAPQGESLAYSPGLDGVRALAVLGVVLFHAGVSWLPAGFLGVDTFFVLSGFLITTLLLHEFQRARTIKLLAFWGRRARRLLPALFVVVGVTSLFVWLIAAKGTYPGFRGDAIASLFYVANWHFILQGSNYFVVAGAPSPLTHTWSLAIEEQFYIVWPLFLVALYKLRGGARSLLVACVLGAVGSTLWMGYLFEHGAAISRLYYGTDTHAMGLFVGAGLAALLSISATRRAPRHAAPKLAGRAQASQGQLLAVASPLGRAMMTGLGIAGLVGGAALWRETTSTSGLLYKGGFLIMAVSAAGVIASVMLHPHGVVSRALSVAPLVFLGRISYGVYLWHFPLFQWLDSTRTGLSGSELLALRLSVTGVVSVASFYLIERPIRHGGLFHKWRGIAVALLSLGMVAGLVVEATAVTTLAATPLPARPSVSPIVSTLPGANPPVTVLVIGDSMAVSLAQMLLASSLTAADHVTVIDRGIPGCGIIQSDGYVYFGHVFPREQTCLLHSPDPTNTPFQGLAVDMSVVHPNVVAISAGRMEVSDLIINNETLNITQPMFQAQVTTGLEQMIQIATSNGAKVVLFTLPCAQPVTNTFGQTAMQPDGKPWPENTPARKDIYNRILRSVAEGNSATTSVVNTDALVCPGGRFQWDIDGQAVRAPDGVHYAMTNSYFLVSHILPPLIAAGTPPPAPPGSPVPPPGLSTVNASSPH